MATCINGVRFKIKGNSLLLQIWMNAKVHENLLELRTYMKESLQIYDDRVFTLLLFPSSTK